METKGFLLLIARHPLHPASCSWKSRLFTGELDEDHNLLEQRADEERPVPSHGSALKEAVQGNEATLLTSWCVLGQCMR